MQSKVKFALLSGALAIAGAASAVTLSSPFRTLLSGDPGHIEGNGALTVAPQKAPVSTGPQRLGENNPLVPPFCETFDNFREGMEHDDFPRYFDVDDANGDGRTWGLYNVTQDRQYGRCAYLLHPLTEVPSDDWLITRAVKLEKGKYYCIGVHAGSYKQCEAAYPKTFEIKVSNYNDAAGMEAGTTVVGPTDVFSPTLTRVQGWFCPPYTATYYIGVHGITSRIDWLNYLFVDNISVDAPCSGSVAGPVTDIVMKNDPDGTNALVITFTAPTTTLAGDPLTALESVAVKRAGVKVASISPVEPGKTYTFTDTPPAEGFYEYSFIPVTAEGEGASAYKGHTAGAAAPLAPVITEFAELEDGRIRLAWTAPTRDVNGNEINPEKVTYNVNDVSTEEGMSVARDYVGTEVVYNPYLSPGEQRMAICTLTATIGGKESDATVSDHITVGTPYTLPYHNSFTLQDYYDYVMSVEMKDNVTWRLLDDFSQPSPQDGDNGYICMVSNIPGITCKLYLGKLSLAKATRPVMTFYTYIYNDDENEINVYLSGAADADPVATVKLADYGGRIGWYKITVPLYDYAGQDVNPVIEGVVKTHGYIPVDNLLIQDQHAVDLEPVSMIYPLHAGAGEDIDIYATIFNNGYETVSDYTVTLLAGDREVVTVPGEPVAALGDAIVGLSDKFTSVSPQSTDYRIRINSAADADQTNNLSAPFTIVFEAPMHPAVTDLTATESDGGKVTLTWSAPDLTKAAPFETTEDFESYAPFATNLPGWTMHDMDEGLVYGFNGLAMPVDGSCQAYWVMSDDEPYGFVPTVSGHKAIVAMYTLNANKVSVKNDDWLVSPELYGGHQSLQFWACSLTDDNGCDEFEIWVSKGGTQPYDFEKITDVIEAPAEWTRFFFALPEGTKHFAIRYVSENRYMLSIDDITYVPAGTPRPIELKGYNVYRNGQRITDTPVTGTTFDTTRSLPDADYYFVTAVYDLGESIASNLVGVGESGLGQIEVPGSETAVELFDLQGRRVTTANPGPGIYVRRTGTHVEKIAIF